VAVPAPCGDGQLTLPYGDAGCDESAGVSYTSLRRMVKDTGPLAAFTQHWGAETLTGAVEAACAELRAKCGQAAFPIELTPILNHLNATRRSSEMTPRGRLHVNRDGWSIQTRPDLPWRSRRFTEAHEIGHILLYLAVANEPEEMRRLQTPRFWMRVEHVCNRIAAELLVPKEDLYSRLQSRPLRTSLDFDALYDRYLVSTSALMRRIPEAVPRTAVSVWKFDQDHPNGPDWRLTTAYTQVRGWYFPNVSRRRLMPDLIGDALESGSSFSPEATLDLDSRRYRGSMLAIDPRVRAAPQLPMFHGRRIEDEPASGTMYIVHDGLSSSPVSRGRSYRRGLAKGRKATPTPNRSANKEDSA